SIDIQLNEILVRWRFPAAVVIEEFHFVEGGIPPVQDDIEPVGFGRLKIPWVGHSERLHRTIDNATITEDYFPAKRPPSWLSFFEFLQTLFPLFQNAQGPGSGILLIPFFMSLNPNSCFEEHFHIGEE